MISCPPEAQRVNQGTCLPAWWSSRGRWRACSAASSCPRWKSLPWVFLTIQNGLSWPSNVGFLDHPKWALLTIQNRLPNLSYSLHLGGESHILWLATDIQVEYCLHFYLSCVLWFLFVQCHMIAWQWLVKKASSRSPSHWPCCNLSFMTECQSDVMRLGCGASRKKVGQVGNWLQLEGPDFVHPCMHRCSAKRPSLSAFQSNWGRFQKPAGMRFSLWQSCRWPKYW